MNLSFLLQAIRFTVIPFYLQMFIPAVGLSQNHQEYAGCRYNDSYMQTVYDQVNRNIAQLKQEGKLVFPNKKNIEDGSQELFSGKSVDYITFHWPLRSAVYTDFDYWTFNNFYDLDGSSDGDDDVHEPEEIEDYECGDRTYDGHLGIDIGIGPYSWKAQFEGAVEVIAAAPGIIVSKLDGEYDENCDWDTEIEIGRGNHIAILHEDSSTVSFYMHMKNGSLTSKDSGDYVMAGEYLGTVASSGRSTGPHLHFQVNTLFDDPYFPGGYAVDLMEGDCHSFYYASPRFEEQPAYVNPGVITLETHSSAADYYYDDFCDKDLDLYFDNSFSGTKTVYFRSIFRDYVSDDAIALYIYRPNGTVRNVWFRYVDEGYRDRYVDDFSTTFSILDAVGTYKFETTFGGQTYSHYFAYNCLTDQTLSGAVSGHKGNMVSNSITSTQTISGVVSNYVKYMADNYVDLKPGFQATAGCKFVANTLGCENSTAFTEEEPLVSKMWQGLGERNFLEIYPNPNLGTFHVQQSQILETEVGLLMIRDPFGRIVAQYQTEPGIWSQQVLLDHIPKGVYWVVWTTTNHTEMQQVVVQ